MLHDNEYYWSYYSVDQQFWDHMNTYGLNVYGQFEVTIKDFNLRKFHDFIVKTQGGSPVYGEFQSAINSSNKYYVRWFPFEEKNETRKRIISNIFGGKQKIKKLFQSKIEENFYKHLEEYGPYVTWCFENGDSLTFLKFIKQYQNDIGEFLYVNNANGKKWIVWQPKEDDVRKKIIANLFEMISGKKGVLRINEPAAETYVKFFNIVVS